MKLTSVWWRRITPNDLFNIEKPLPPGPKGQLHLDVPNVQALHSFFDISHDNSSDSWKPIMIDLHVLRDPTVVRRITFRPRPKNNRYDIQRQNINSDSSERHPGWTSAFGWPAIHGKIKSTTEAGNFLNQIPLTILILKDSEGSYYADFFAGDFSQFLSNTELHEILDGKSTGSIINISNQSRLVLEKILNLDSKILPNSISMVSGVKQNRLHSGLVKRGIRSKSQGFGLSSEMRRAIEKYAVKMSIEYFKGKGWSNIQDVGDVASYDLTMVGDGVVHIVEVKGTTGVGESIFLTKNEVAIHKEYFPKNALVIVSEINIDSSDPILLSGGELKVIQPWSLVEDWLTPISYSYDAVNHNEGA